MSKLHRLKDTPSNDDSMTNPLDDDMHKSMIVQDNNGLDDYEIGIYIHHILRFITNLTTIII
jgi:hypothetical protein